MSAVIDLDNATKGSIAFSGIAIWGGVKGSGCRDIADASLAWLTTQTPSRPQVPKEVRDDQARPEYRWLADQGRE
jgi:hypothetical protein